MNAVTNAENGSGLLTVAEVAERLRCSEPTVRRRIRDGQIPAVKLGQDRSVIRIDAAELNNWLYQREDLA
jgi:excisionase family DNA binding protein